MENNNDGASNSPACAACRHQRKKCKVRDCVLWPHFPSDQMEDFQAVHRVFGIANVTKMMKEVDKDQRAAAANSLLWEANSWTEDPVHGPLGRFNRLEQELNDLKAALLQYQPAMDAVAILPSPGPSGANNFVPMGDDILSQSSVHRYSSPISNGGFQNPYPNTNFGQGIDLTWSAPVRPYNQTQEIRTNLLIPEQSRPQSQSPVYNCNSNLIRGDEYAGAMYSGPLNLPVIRGVDNVGTIFSGPHSLQIRGEDNVGTSFHSLSRSNIRGDYQDNVRTKFSSSTNPPVKREGDIAASQQHLRNSNQDKV